VIAKAATAVNEEVTCTIYAQIYSHPHQIFSDPRTSFKKHIGLESMAGKEGRGHSVFKPFTAFVNPTRTES
jgi:hypothetical protein